MPVKVTIIIEDTHESVNAQMKMEYKFRARPDRAKVGELAGGVWDRVFNPAKITPSRGVEA